MRKKRKNFKTIIATLMIISSLIFGSLPVLANANVHMTENSTSVVYNSTPENTSRSTDVVYPTSTSFYLSKNIYSIKYTAASYADSSVTSGYILLRFTNNDNGYYCTHSFGVPNLGGTVNCNMTAGNYTITRGGVTSLLLFFI